MAALFVGYARVSTDEQDLTAQRDALSALGVNVERIYVDHGLTGTNRDRPGLREALAACRDGDTLVVTKLDRLARSLPDARDIVEGLTARNVKLRLGGSVHDPTDPVGRLLFNVLAMVAEFEGGRGVRGRSDPRAHARGHEDREGQGTPARQAAQAQPDAGGAPRQALPRGRAHRQRTRRALRGHALHRLPRHPARRAARYLQDMSRRLKMPVADPFTNDADEPPGHRCLNHATVPTAGRPWDSGDVTKVIVEVPAMAGDGAHPASQGPAAMTGALRAAGRRLAVRTLRIPARTGDVEAASLRVACELAAVVRDASKAGQVPLVLAGSCDVAPGVLAGLADERCGVVWIDAHADFNTPSSSRSGFWPGMTLAVAVGDCGEHARTTLGFAAVPESHVALLGVRSLSPAAEAQRLHASELHVVGWRDGQPERSVAETLDRLAEHVDRAYVHLDLDALDPSIGRGVVDTPVPGGLTASQLFDLLLGVRERFTIAAATIATYVPASDHGSTPPIAITAAQILLGQHR